MKTETVPTQDLQLDLVDLLRDTFAGSPELFDKAEWVPLSSLLTHVLHKYDLYRVRLLYTHKETGKLDTTKMKEGIIEALESLGFVELRGETIDIMEYRLLEVPEFLPETMQEAIVQIKQYRKALRTWKDLGALVVDLHGVVNAMKSTTEDQERLLRRMGALAAYYRDRLLEQQEQLAIHQDFLVANKIFVPNWNPKTVDPTPDNLAEMVMSPEKAIKLTRLMSMYNKLQDDHADVK